MAFSSMSMAAPNCRQNIVFQVVSNVSRSFSAGPALQPSETAKTTGSASSKQVCHRMSVRGQCGDRRRRATLVVMTLHPLAGRPAPASMLVDVRRLVTAYYTERPDISETSQKVSSYRIGSVRSEAVAAGARRGILGGETAGGRGHRRRKCVPCPGFSALRAAVQATNCRNAVAAWLSPRRVG
jgi:hypothetical protein